jgi:hypothetical protein
MLCDVCDTVSKCRRCGFRHPGFPIPRECKTIEELREEQAIQRTTLHPKFARPGNGPGTELKKLLAGWPFRIVSTPDCKCNRRAAHMDGQGCDWCESEEGMAEIMGFLQESAAERGLPFVDALARLLVRRAISNARKAEAARARGSQRHN